MTFASGSGTLSFTPPNNVDTFVFYYPTNTTLGSCTVQIDSGATTSVNENLPAGGYTSVTLTASLGSHTFNVNWASGVCFWASIVGYNSSSKEISIYNMGWAASLAANWDASTYGWDPINAIALVAPDLTFIDLTINDWNAGTNLSTYSAEIQALITAAKASGDVILMSGNPSDPTFGSDASLATQQTYVAAMETLAYSNNVPMIDVWTLFGGTWSGPNTSGWMFDSLHPNGTGYGMIAGYVNEALASGFRAQ